MTIDNLENDIPVFESFRVYNGVIFRFDEHLQRLRKSAHACGIDLPPLKQIYDSVLDKIKKEKIREGFIRMNFRSGDMQIMLRAAKPRKGMAAAVDLKTSSFRMPSPKTTDSQAKTGNYRLQLLAGKPEDASEWLFLDENHFLTESRVGNFFIVKKGVVLTPPARSVLNGITREVVIECARESGLLVRETPLTRHEAFNADEAFLTNTSWEILPVRSLDGRAVQEMVPGPVTKKLIHCFHRKVQIACQPQKKPPIH